MDKMYEYSLDDIDESLSNEEYMTKALDKFNGLKDYLAKIRKYALQLEEELAGKMKERNIEKIQLKLGDDKIRVSYGKSISMSLTEEAVSTLTRMLWNGDEKDKETALRCMAGGQTPWNKRIVREFGKSVGKNYVDVTEKERVVVKIVNEKYLTKSPE